MHQEIAIRLGQKRFFDNRKFPRGFGKSGDFTLSEADLLTMYGDTLNALQHGELLAANDEEDHFLAVLKDPSKARSRVEKVWLKYQKLAYGRRSFHTLHSAGKSSGEEMDESEDAVMIDDE